MGGFPAFGGTFQRGSRGSIKFRVPVCLGVPYVGKLPNLAQVLI